jgi:hypothetical protein
MRHVHRKPVKLAWWPSLKRSSLNGLKSENQFPIGSYKLSISKLAREEHQQTECAYKRNSSRSRKQTMNIILTNHHAMVHLTIEKENPNKAPKSTTIIKILKFHHEHANLGISSSGMAVVK